MALQDLLDLSNQRQKIGLSEERVKAMIPVARKYIAFWRDYPDLFIDFMSQGTTFELFYYQRVFLRGVIRHKYFYGVFPRAYSKSFLSMLILMIRCILYPGAKLFVTSGGKIKIILIKGGALMSAKNVLTHFENIDTEEKAYWLGFLYADGSVGSKENKIELGLSEKDLKHIEKFKNFMGISNKISYRPETKSYRISFRSEKCKMDLINKGCVPKKSLVLTFPSEEQVPKHLIRHFVRGYFDGDGWFSNTDDCFQIGIIGTQDFISGFLLTIENINNKNKIFNVHRENGVKRYIFSAYNDVLNFLNWIYKDSIVFLDRKYEKYLDFLKNGKRR